MNFLSNDIVPWNCCEGSDDKVTVPDEVMAVVPEIDVVPPELSTQGEPVNPPPLATVIGPWVQKFSLPTPTW